MTVALRIESTDMKGSRHKIGATVTVIIYSLNIFIGRYISYNCTFEICFRKIVICHLSIQSPLSENNKVYYSLIYRHSFYINPNCRQIISWFTVMLLLNVYLQYSFVTVPTSRMIRCEMVENVTACDLYVLIRFFNYRKISNIRRTLVSNKIVDHSTTSSFST